MKKRTLLISAVVAVPILMVVLSGSRTNPEIESEVTWDSPETKELFYRACADCHSNETKWPWYSRVAPVSWLVIHHVNEAREEFSISAADLGEADEAAEHLREGHMPPWEYVILHSKAKLSTEEKNLLVAGLTNTFGSEDEEDEHHHEHGDDH